MPELNTSPRVIVCFGPGPRFKGGIQNYNTSLALALDKKPNTKVHIVSWTQQYPAIVPREFVDKTSKADLLAGSNVSVHYVTNYNRQSTWSETVRLIQSLHAHKVIIQWSIALQGLPLRFIARKLAASGIQVIFDLHFVNQKENSRIDKFFTRLALPHATGYIVHALKTWNELRALFPKAKLHLSGDGIPSGEGKMVIKLFHPIYDLFKPNPEFDIEKFKSTHHLRKHVFLFFGFIRKYKGLHHTIEAFAKVAQQRDDVSLLICGESFWNTLDQSQWSTRIKNWTFNVAKKIFLSGNDDERNYQPLELIHTKGITDRCVVFNSFIPNEDVHKYFQVSDAVVLYYLTATPSGIESLSYNFKLPILATSVGHFPETIQDGFNGYLAKAGDVDDMARQMLRFIENPLPGENVTKATAQMSWGNYAEAILKT
jgi:glycosyltransferase involved in cell wall biosynthesis